MDGEPAFFFERNATRLCGRTGRDRRNSHCWRRARRDLRTRFTRLEVAMVLKLTTCTVRSWRPADAQALASYANNRRIWLNLRDRFPHPYTHQDALQFLRSIIGREPETLFAIAVEGRAVGGIGFVLQQ